MWGPATYSVCGIWSLNYDYRSTTWARDEFGTDSITLKDLCYLRWSDVRLFISSHTTRWGRVRLKLHVPETLEVLDSKFDNKTSAVKSAPFLFLVGGVLAKVFDAQHDSNDIFALLSADSQSLSTPSELNVKDECKTKTVFRQDIDETESLLANAIQAVAGSAEEYRILQGPSTQNSSRKPFQPWLAKTIMFNGLDLDVCLSSQPSDQSFNALLEYYGCSRGLLTYYFGEVPVNEVRCCFCNQKISTNKITRMKHIHSCARDRVASIDTNFLPWPSVCKFLVANVSVRSGDHVCNKALFWGTKRARNVSLLHFAAHRAYWGSACYWSGCATVEDAEIVGGVKFASTDHLASHFESVHGFSARERTPLFCYFCDCWLPRCWQTDVHFWSHKEEMEASIRECGFGPVTCLYSEHRILKPFFCPFCYHIADLLPSTRFAQYGDKGILLRHVKAHIGRLSNTLTHQCPVYLAHVCNNDSQMTPSDLGHHLRADHDLCLA